MRSTLLEEQVVSSAFLASAEGEESDKVVSKGRSGRLHHQMRLTLRCCKDNSTSQSDSQNHTYLDEVDSGGHRVDSTEDFSMIQVKSYGYASTL
ncbi:hypothetical protein Taro_002160 [Colocasia esculenta]|uniref:Uncharacterized protein n=1 Tax=Colocasia esculenta TaxID=4460 RepID=A0A843TD91_COLES|nr:hypothetical protein [Colocasia esculenta]